MNRKIAAIFAADVAGFSTLVADDEEDALRRLKSYRAVIDDFIRQFGGTIFNTAGDSVMASFPSAVDAVRCSIDIQESLRTRNRAYPETRHMTFRIGINIGDVVERDGDLLGDGVNLAARLQALAEPGGVCISRSVHEQVVGKLSVGFDDLGEQTVKNIPTPVHVFGVAWRDEARGRARVGRVRLPWVAAGLAVVLVAAVSGYLVVRGKPKVVATAPASEPVVIVDKSAAGPAPALTPSPSPPGPSAAPARRPFVADAVPFLTNGEHKTLAELYVPATGFKAIALNRTRHGYVIGAVDEEAAKSVAMQRCEARAKQAGYTSPCELYAVGDLLVWPYAQPPLPARPWVRRDTVIEQPVTLQLLARLRPLVGERIVLDHLAHKAGKVIALHPHRRRGGMDFYKATAVSEDDAMRSVLELCAHKVKEPCVIVAVGDTMVVPVPMTMLAVGIFRPAMHPLIAAEHRESLDRRLAGAPGGWSAIAVGGSGQPETAWGQPSEERATSAALAGCARRERDCKIIAIGPFSVEPNQAEPPKIEAPKLEPAKLEPAKPEPAKTEPASPIGPPPILGRPETSKRSESETDVRLSPAQPNKPAP